MKLIKHAVGLLTAVVAALAVAAPAHAVTAGSGSVANESGLIQSGRMAVKTSARASCLYAAYTLSQVESDRVKVSYLLKDGCRGHQVMTWATRTDRFATSSAPGDVKHNEWKCYTCHRISRAVYMHDPMFGQTFQAMTVYIGLTGSDHTNDVPRGKTWTT